MDTEATTPAAPSESEEPRAEAPRSDEDLAAELTAAKALADERYQELQYARAEIENVRKRAVRIADERLGSSRKALIGKFLPVLDNLERALRFEDGASLRDGLQATLKGFEGLLSSEGVAAIETIGKPFDPRAAEAISTRDSDEHDDDVVVEEVQRGYRLGDDLLRPAMVVVAKRRSSQDGQSAPSATAE
jgi:molecular chaperone GrpE